MSVDSADLLKKDSLCGVKNSRFNGLAVVRSATFEGMADGAGFPSGEYRRYYEMLAGYIGTIVTGFMYISEEGRAMHPGQAGLDSPEKAEAFRPVTEAVHAKGSRILAQLAHAGRQTAGPGAAGVTEQASPYFGVKPRVLSGSEIQAVAGDFGRSAGYAKAAGFDGVQLHAAHGYLIHQFLLPSVNRRRDEYGEPCRFLSEAVGAVRSACGPDFPLWVKVSADTDIEPYEESRFLELIRQLDRLKVDAVEISRGTMDYALNIFRGGVPLRTVLRYNPVYASKGPAWKAFVLPFERLKYKGFRPCYNLKYALLAQKHTGIPVICVGGFRGGAELAAAGAMGLRAVSLCRPFIREPDFLKKLEENPTYISKCLNCNICAVMVDVPGPLRCYGGRQP